MRGRPYHYGTVISCSGSRDFLLRHRPRCVATNHLYSQSAKPPHDDLESFLRHANEKKLNSRSKVYRGTLYEYTVLRTFSQLGMKLSRSGGPGDRGLDLYGTWKPPRPKRLPARKVEVFVQCKCESQKAGPRIIREFEGALASVAQDEGGGEDLLGILACVRTCTRGLVNYMLLSKRPLAFCSVASHADGGYLRQLIWNHAASKVVGQGLGVTTRYSRPLPASVKNARGLERRRLLEEVVLTLKGKPIKKKSIDRSKRKR